MFPLACKPGPFFSGPVLTSYHYMLRLTVDVFEGCQVAWQIFGVPVNLEIALGQKLRELVHVRRFRAALSDPGGAQRRKLLRIVRANAGTAFGRKHGFDKIATAKDYQAAVPPHTYEDLRSYVEAEMDGQEMQLTRERPVMFASTSGTTARPKFLPITPSHLRDYSHAFQLHNYQMIRDYPAGASGRFLIIASNDVEGYTRCGVPYGAVSGLLYRSQPPIIKRYFALPYELSKIKNVDSKYYLMLRVAATQNVTAILCCNPSSLLLMAGHLREHASSLIDDIYQGTVDRRFVPGSEVAEAIRPYLRPNRSAARHLNRLLEERGTLSPQDLWPNLTLISCWKGGPMSFYLERLPALFGGVPVRDFGYMASEGRGTVPLANDGAAGVLAVTSHFFEFVPESEAGSPAPTFLTAEELDAGGRYYIYFTTAAGLYRYNIEDLVEVVGFNERTPVIQFIRKGAGFSSITGEKLTEEQVRMALQQTIRRLGMTEIEHFTASVRLGDPPCYALFVELNAGISRALGERFLEMFDRSLGGQNREYSEKRASKRLGAPVLEIVEPGTYARLRQKRVTEGAPEAQVKIPLLASYGDFPLAAGGRPL